MSPTEAPRARYYQLLRNPYLVCAVAAAVVFGAVIPLPRGRLPDSDMAIILDALREDDSWWAVGSWFVGDWVQRNGYYRPLASVSLWLDFKMWGDSLWGYRVTNRLIVGVTMLALVWLAQSCVGTGWAGVVGGLVLVLSAEARYMMDYAPTRTDGLCALFLCLATASAISYVREGRRGRLLLSLGMLLAALLCKEVAFIWPVFAAVAALVWGVQRRAAVTGASAFALAGAVWIVRAAALGIPLTGAPVEVLNYPLGRQVQQFATFLLGPVYYHVTVSYPYTEPSLGVLLVQGVHRMVLLDLWFVAANVLLLLGDVRTFCIAWAWRVIMYLPSLPFGYFRPHYWYIPVLGNCLLHGAAMILAGRWVRRRFAKARGPRADESK